LRTPDPRCCIATAFDNTSIRETVVLGHSLAKTANPPRALAFATSAIPKDSLAIVSKYFTVIPTTLPPDAFPEFAYWNKAIDCFPLVAVNHTGAFNRAVDELCQAVPFSSVARLGDIVYFDAALMVLDPKSKPPPIGGGFPTFQKLVNQAIIDWKILPSDRLVVETDNEYLDFWLEYGSPLYVNFNETSFIRAMQQPSKNPGAPLFRMITKFVAAAMDAHPELFGETEKKKGKGKRK
jgi:hypothetical protein